MRLFNTFVFECSDYEMKSVRVRSPPVRDVLEREKIRSCVDGADALAGVSARQISLHNSVKEIL